jgi:hypothetical protein
VIHRVSARQEAVEPHECGHYEPALVIRQWHTNRRRVLFFRTSTLIRYNMSIDAAVDWNALLRGDRTPQPDNS